MATLTQMPHPGEFIREELEARDWSQRDLAYVLGAPEQAVNMIISGKRGISADMARALADAFGVSAELFVNLQSAFDLSRAREPDPSVSRKGRLQSSYPIREMIKRGWLSNGEPSTLDREIASFFEAASVAEIPHLAPAHAAMKSSYEDTPPVQLAWLYRVRQLAREMVVPRFSRPSLVDTLSRLHGLMGAPEECRNVPRLLTDCGVRFVIVEGLPGGKIDGVCTWLNSSSPVIGLSLRYDRIDNFWFVLRHEIEHVLNGDGKSVAIIDTELEGERGGTGEALPVEERNANAAAAAFCVPTKELESFVARKSPYFSERDLLAFSAKLGVHPGIVAGQLRRRINNWKIFTKLLVKIRFALAPSAVTDGWGDVAPAAL